jgi:hypothetical protein
MNRIGNSWFFIAIGFLKEKTRKIMMQYLEQ